MTFFSSPITTTRASVGTYISAAGSLTSFAANALRVGDIGALIEPAATQLLHETDALTTQNETVTAQPYTLHFRGTGQIVLTGAHSATLTGTGATDLVSLTFTPSAGTLTITPSGTVDFPQLEVGSYATSYIPNTAASGTATRAADLVTSTAPASTVPLAMTLVIVAPAVQATGTFNVIAQIDDGTDGERLVAFLNSDTGQIVVSAQSGGASPGLTIGTPTPGATITLNLTWAGDTMTGQIDDGTVATVSSVTMPTGLTTIRYGSNSGGAGQPSGGVLIKSLKIAEAL